MENNLAMAQESALPATGGKQDLFTLSPRNLQEAMQYADLIANSGMVPKDYKGQPGNVLVAVQMGAEIGLPPIQALQNIAVINGRPSIWGDALKAVIMASPICEYIKEWFDEETKTAYCETKRRNHEPHLQAFSEQDAKRAGLLGKQGPWSQYPQRMMKMRARGFCLRDQYPDVLKGIACAEEEQDRPPEKDISPAASGPAAVTSGNSKTSSLKQKLKDKQPAIEAEPVEPTQAVDHSSIIQTLIDGISACQTLADLDEAGADIARVSKDIPKAALSPVRKAYQQQKNQLEAEAANADPQTGELLD